MKNMFLHKPLRRYLIAGSLFSCMILCLIGLHNYKSSLLRTAESLSRAPLNLRQMQDAIVEMEQVIETINGLYPHMQSLSRKDALLLAADNINRAAPGARLALSDMIAEGAEAALPMEIVIATNRYGDIVGLAGYLQSLTIPYAVIQELHVEKEGLSRSTCTIKAVLRIPQDSGQGYAAPESAPPP